MLQDLNAYNGIICGNFLHNYLQNAEKILVPKIGVKTGNDLHDTDFPDITGTLHYLNENLEYGFSLGLTERQFSIYNRIIQTLVATPRFKNDPGLKPTSGGNVASHTLFAIFLCYHFHKYLVDHCGISAGDEQLQNSFRVMSRKILCHDGGEGMGEFGSLFSQIIGLTGKDYTKESDIFRGLLVLSAFTELKGEEAIYYREVFPIQTKVKDIIALADDLVAGGKLAKEKRDGWLGERIIKELENFFSLVDKVYPSLEAHDKEFIDRQMEYYDSVENFKDFTGSFARLAEKLEGTLHILVVGHKDKLSNHKIFDPLKNRPFGSRKYMETKLWTIFAHKNPENKIESLLSDLMSSAVYETVATHVLRCYPTVQRHPQRGEGVLQNSGGHLPAKILSLHDCWLYLDAARNNHAPTEEAPMLIGLDKAPAWHKKPKLAQLNELAEFAKAQGVIKEMPAREGGTINGFAERYMQAAAGRSGRTT